MEFLKKYGPYVVGGAVANSIISNMTSPKTAATFGLLYKPVPGTAGKNGVANAAGISNSL